MGVRDFLGGLLVKTASTAGGMGLIPVQGTKILHATCCGQKKKKKDSCLQVTVRTKHT